MADFEIAVAKTLRAEGGDKVTDDPNDAGGLTKYGISQRAYPNTNIRGLTEDNAKGIYRRDYWNPVRGDEISNQRIAETLFDFAVNAGVKTAIRICQHIIGVAPDGVMGGVTVRKLNEMSDDLFLAVFALSKIARYVAICRKNPEQKKFLFGWVSRSLEGIVS